MKRADISPKDARCQGAASTTSIQSRLDQIHAMPEPVFLQDPKGRFTDCNQAFARLIGCSARELCGKTTEEVWVETSRTQVRSSDASGRAHNGCRICHYTTTDQAGEVKNYTCRKYIQHGADNRVLGFVGLVSERKQAETEPDPSAPGFGGTLPLLGAVLDAIPDVIGVQDPQLRIVCYNRSGYDFLGTTPEEARGKTCYQLMGQESGCEICPAAETRRTRQSARALKYQETIDRWIDVRTYPILDGEGNIRQIVKHIRDITKEIKSEQQRVETQKFEAIGTLAGGLAHEFNNLLMAIQGRASLMAANQHIAPDLIDHLRAIEGYIHSATNLTKKLLGFAQGGKYAVQAIDVNRLVQQSVANYSQTDIGISTIFALADPPPVVEGDRSQIEQVLFSLYANALQAMADTGELRLQTATVKVDENLGSTCGLAPGRYAKITVKDSGIGISPTIQHRIFDPFFTTKDKGRGAGLGLASAYGIIKNHGGGITVESEIGRGSTFSIYLPAADSSPLPARDSQTQRLKGSETVLLVDDEAMVLEVGQAMLEKLGYRVLACHSGQQAVETVRAKGGEIELVILDLIMPGMDGGQVFDCIRQLHPHIPVILCSGYSIEGQAGGIMERGCNGFMQKPFDLSTLSRAIRTVMGR